MNIEYIHVAALTWTVRSRKAKASACEEHNSIVSTNIVPIILVSTPSSCNRVAEVSNKNMYVTVCIIHKQPETQRAQQLLGGSDTLINLLASTHPSSGNEGRKDWKRIPGCRAKFIFNRIKTLGHLDPSTALLFFSEVFQQQVHHLGCCPTLQLPISWRVVLRSRNQKLHRFIIDSINCCNMNMYESVFCQ